MTKVKVIEVEATKLDPNAKYLIVFNDHQFEKVQMERIHNQLEAKGIDIIGTYAKDPETALKVYQIPTLPSNKDSGK